MARKLNFMVGDYVLIDGKPRKIDAVHQKKVGWHKRYDKLEWARFGVIEPIPLTMDLVKKCGFFTIDMPNCNEILMSNGLVRIRAFAKFEYKVSQSMIFSVEGDKGEFTFLFGEGNDHLHRVENLHTLQGIVRVFTGKEIELKFE